MVWHRLRLLFDIRVRLLRKVEGPVADVEEGKDGGEDDPRQHVDLLSPARELVEPGHEKVLPLPGLHVYLALVDVVEGREARDAAFVAPPQQRLLKIFYMQRLK